MEDINSSSKLFVLLLLKDTIAYVDSYEMKNITQYSNFVHRAKVLTYGVRYLLDPLVIVSTKPKPLSQYLALVRPFPGEINVYSLL